MVLGLKLLGRRPLPSRFYERVLYGLESWGGNSVRTALG